MKQNTKDDIMAFCVLIGVPIGVIVAMFTYSYLDTNPYTEGSHWDYSIEYENGFVYKETRWGRNLILNTNGKPLKTKDVYLFEVKNGN